MTTIKRPAAGERQRQAESLIPATKASTDPHRGWSRAKLLEAKHAAQRELERYMRESHTPTGRGRERMLAALREIRAISKTLARRRLVVPPKGRRS